MNFTAFFIYRQLYAVKKGGFIGFDKSDGAFGALLFYGKLLFDTKDGQLRSAHSCIGNVTRMSVKNYFVCSLDMGVSPDNCRYPARKIEAHGLFLGSCLGVKIDKDIGGVHLPKKPVGTFKGIIERLHKGCSHEVYDTEAVSAHINHSCALSRHAFGVIGRAEKIFLYIIVFGELFASEAVVSCGYHIAKAEKLFHRSFGNAVAVCGIFSVGYDHIKLLLCSEPAYGLFGKVTAALTNYIAYE